MAGKKKGGKKGWKKPRVVEISERRWATPKNIRAFNKDSGRVIGPMLYEPNSKMMCCLGFVCRALGSPIEDIAMCGLPSSAGTYPNWLINVEVDASAINDAAYISDTARKIKLKKLFEEHTPIRLKFVK